MRKFVLELLLTNHPLDCPVCEAAGDCRLQDYAYEYLVDMVPWGWRPPQAGDPGDASQHRPLRRPLHPLRPVRAHLPRGHGHRLLGLSQPRL